MVTFLNFMFINIYIIFFVFPFSLTSFSIVAVHILIITNNAGGKSV